MKEQLALQRILQSRFAALQSKNPSYSIRAFAKKAGVSPGTLSLILLGKRAASKKLAARIAEKLLLDPQERSEMLEQFTTKPPAAVSETGSLGSNYVQLSADQFHVVSEWYYFA